jgi:hypothetical protein
MKNDATVILVPLVIGYVVTTLSAGVVGMAIPAPANYVAAAVLGLLAGFVTYRARLKLSRGEKESGTMKNVMLTISALVIAAGIALFGLAFWLQGELHGFMAFPQIVGILGIVVTLVGIANLLRLMK